MSAERPDPRRQREAINVATRLLGAFLDENRAGVADGLTKLAEMDEAGYFIALGAVMRDYLSASEREEDVDIPDFVARARACLGDTPLTSLLDPIKESEGRSKGKGAETTSS